MVAQLVVHPAPGPLRGSVPVPVDPLVLSIALGVAALSQGETRLHARAVPEPVTALAGALGAFGVEVRGDGGGLVVVGRGLFGLTAPTDVLDARGMPVAAFVLAGLCAGAPFESALLVDEAVAEELAGAFGGLVEISSTDGGGRVLRFPSKSQRPAGVRARVAGARPGVKVAALLAGLRAGSTTIVHEGIASADHCERLLTRLRIPVGSSASALDLHPPRDVDALAAFELPEVGDFSAAAYLLAAGALVPQSHVTVRDIGLNPTRSAFLDALRTLGVRAGTTPHGDALGEPVGEVSAFGSGARGGLVGGEIGVRLGDDFVPAALVAVAAQGTVELSDVLSGGGVWSSAEGTGAGRDVARLVGLLRSFGVEAAPTSAGLVIEGAAGKRLRATQFTTGGDHRLALGATVLALLGDGPTVVDDVGCIARFFPRFVGSLRALGARIEVRAE
jgi:3-phosphoshikimate 1-carboxyvinyltransferase